MLSFSVGENRSVNKRKRNKKEEKKQRGKEEGEKQKLKEASILLTFRHKQQVSEESQLRCVFWDEQNNDWCVTKITTSSSFLLKNKAREYTFDDFFVPGLLWAVSFSRAIPSTASARATVSPTTP